MKKYASYFLLIFTIGAITILILRAFNIFNANERGFHHDALLLITNSLTITTGLFLMEKFKK